MVGLLVKAGNKGLSPLSPSTLGVQDAPAPQPPRTASGRGRAGREEGRGGHATQNSHCIEGTCGLEGQGGAGPAGDERAQPREKACRPGRGDGGSRDGGKRAEGYRKETLPSSRGGERGPTRTDPCGLRKGHETQTFPTRGCPRRSAHPSTTHHRPQTHLLTHTSH